MKTIVKIFSLIIGVILFFTTIAFFTGNISLEFQRYFGKKQQNIETEIFKETEMYKEAKIQQLAKLRLEYLQADSEKDKNAIASTIRLRHSDDEASKYPTKLSKFLTEIRGY